VKREITLCAFLSPLSLCRAPCRPAHHPFHGFAQAMRRHRRPRRSRDKILTPRSSARVLLAWLLQQKNAPASPTRSSCMARHRPCLPRAAVSCGCRCWRGSSLYQQVIRRTSPTSSQYLRTRYAHDLQNRKHKSIRTFIVEEFFLLWYKSLEPW
jgi:hypothetical protein